MNRILPALALVLAASFPIALAQGPGGGGGSPLGRYMHDLEETLGKIGELLEAEGGLEEALSETLRIQKVVIDCKAEAPRMFSRFEDDEKKLKKAKVEYCEMMQELVRALLDMELAIVEESPKKAEKALKTAMKLESKGHGKFRQRGGGR